MSDIQDSILNIIAKAFTVMATIRGYPYISLVINMVVCIWIIFLFAISYHSWNLIQNGEIINIFAFYILPVMNFIFSLIVMLLILLQRGERGVFQGAIRGNPIDSKTMSNQTIKTSLLLFIHVFLNGKMILRYYKMNLLIY